MPNPALCFYESDFQVRVIVFSFSLDLVLFETTFEALLEDILLSEEQSQ